MDMEYGPDGSLYVLEYGDGYFAENPDAQLAKINFVRGNRTPVVKVAATPTAAARRSTVTFSQRRDRPIPDGDPLTYAWDFDGRRQGRLDRARTRRTPTRATAPTARR